MRKLLIIAAAVFSISNNAAAEEPAGESTPLSICTASSSLARTIMKVRQNGMDLSTALEAVSDNEFAKAIVIDAYKKPRYSSEKYQKRAITEFGNENMIACLEAMEKD